MSTIAVDSITDSNGGSDAVLYGVASAPGGMNFRNRIINGDMRIAQRGTAAFTVNGDFPVDRFFFNNVSAASASGQQVADAPAGFTHSLKFTVTTADASLDADDRSGVFQRIEGFNAADLSFGTASAKTVTISFWVKSSITGTFGGSLQNSGLNRSYPFTYSISSANTWEYKTVSIPGDTSGTWATDNTQWGRLIFSVGMGSTRSGTAGAWGSAQYDSATGATSIMSTLNATWYITGVQLEVGSVATEFERRPYGTELQLCQRYYFQETYDGPSYASVFPVARAGSTSTVDGQFYYPVQMRTAPTITYSTAGNFRINNGATDEDASNIVTQQAYTRYARIRLTKPTANLTSNTAVEVSSDGTNNAAIYASAEL